MKSKNPIIGIYKLTSPSGKVYIGQSEDVEERFKHHRTGNKRANPHLERAFKKHGRENFVYEIIEVVDHVDLLNEAEIRLIALYQSNNSAKGYNKTTGGTSRYTLTDDTRYRMSSSHKGLKHPEHVKRKITGKPPGKTLTNKEIQSRKENGIQYRGRKNGPLSDEAKKKMSESAKKRPPMTQQTKDLMSIQRTGRKMPPLSDKDINRLKGYNKERMVKVVCVETGEIFESFGAAGKALGVSNVGSACGHPSKSRGGYHFNFA